MPRYEQTLIETMEGATQAGNPVAYARHLRRQPLLGVPAKSILVQFAKGDQTVPNPNASTYLRAGDLADRATFYRHDLASAETPSLLKNPHFVVSIGAFGAIALGARQQIATFLTTDGRWIVQPEPQRFFEMRVVLPLPEVLNFIP